MNFYHNLYCRICKWYDTTGKKNQDTLRISSISLLSGLPTFNILTIILIISLFIKHTIINKWVAVIIYAIFFITNLLLISRDKSIRIRNEYEISSNNNKKRINSIFYRYFFITISLLVLIIICTVYYKNKYGNYDH
jgi:hypothetical protein